MAHNIGTRADGMPAIVLADRPAWHGLGKVFTEALYSEECIVESGQDWPTLLEEIQLTNGGLEIPGVFATVRGDLAKDDPRRILGVVSDRYKPINNKHAFDWCDALVENGEMRYECAGCLGNGARTWILARMPSYDEIAEGDICYRYILMYNSHDGKSANEIILTSVRGVCANTIALARAMKTPTITIKHKGDIKSKLEYAKQYVSQFDKQFLSFRDSGRLLATRKYTPEQAVEFIDKLFPKPMETEGRAVSIRNNKLAEVRNAMRLERNNLAAIRGTWWKLLNSVTDAIDHSQRVDTSTAKKQEKRFASLIDGQLADFKADAFKLAMEMSA